MNLDSNILNRLDELEVVEFSGEVYRTSRGSLDPLKPSPFGGRWSFAGGSPVLYTSLEKEGALAEAAYYSSLLVPFPTKPIKISTIKTKIARTIRIAKCDLSAFGVDISLYEDHPNEILQKIGAAAAFQEIQGLIVPSARWTCDNLVLFTEHVCGGDVVELIETESVVLNDWAAMNGFL